MFVGRTLFIKKQYIHRKTKKNNRCLLYPKLKYEVWKSIQQHYQYILEHSTIITLLSAQYELSLKKINPKLLNITYSIPNPNTYEEQKSIPIKQKEIIYVGRLYNSTKRVRQVIKNMAVHFKKISGLALIYRRRWN